MVVKEVPTADFFFQPVSSPFSPAGTSGVCSNVADNDEGWNKIPLDVFHPVGNHAENTTLVRNQGLQVDDDNKPAPKNIPGQGGLPLTTNLHPGQTLGWDGMDHRQVIIQIENDASFEGN